MFLDKGKIKKIAMQNESDWYVKKFSTYNHLVVMLFVAFEGYHSIRKVVLGLLVNLINYLIWVCRTWYGAVPFQKLISGAIARYSVISI
jgi:hypothetical protein